MNRTVVITGGSAGIGLAAARELRRAGDRIILLGRNESRLRAAAEELGATPIRADFADPAQVVRAAAEIGQVTDRIDVLVNNAGGLFRGPKCIQVNHLAGFHLAHLLLDRLENGRLITTASLAEAWGVLDVDDPMKNSLLHRSRWLAYGSSKQANILFTIEAARRWADRGILATSFFPGLVRSRFASTSPLFMLGKLIPVVYTSPEKAAGTLVWLADTPAEQLIPGGYYFLREPFAATPRSTGQGRASRLWEASERAISLQAADGPGGAQKS